MNLYEAFYRGKRMTISAATSYAAQTQAAAAFKARQSWQVAVMLVQRADGSQVTHVAVD